MASLVDIFNPSFLMFLGILVLVSALLVVYFESKMREQNHKMASMLNLITNVVDEMNAIKLFLNNQPSSVVPESSTLEKNNIHIIKTDLIPVSDDSDNDSDNGSENDTDNGSENDSENDIEENSDSEDESDLEDNFDNKEVIDISNYNETSDIKILKLNLSNINDIDEDKNVNEFDDLNELDDIDELDEKLSSDSLSVSSDEEQEQNNDLIDISKLNLKTINISNLEEIKNSDNVDYKKFTLNKLRSIVVEKELVADSSKLKKNELLKLLGAE